VRNLSKIKEPMRIAVHSNGGTSKLLNNLNESSYSKVKINPYVQLNEQRNKKFLSLNRKSFNPENHGIRIHPKRVVDMSPMQSDFGMVNLKSKKESVQLPPFMVDEENLSEKSDLKYNLRNM
jgi:hypothetical protein